MKAYLKYGLIAGAAFIIINLISTQAGLSESPAGSALSVLAYAVLAFSIIQTVKERRSLQNGYLTFGQGLGSGMQVTLIAGLLAALWQYINAKFINREFTDKLYEKVEEELAEKGFTDEEMEMASKFSKMMITPGGQAILILVGVLIAGLIMALIIAAIMRKESPHPFGHGNNNNAPANYDNPGPVNDSDRL